MSHTNHGMKKSQQSNSAHPIHRPLHVALPPRHPKSGPSKAQLTPHSTPSVVTRLQVQSPSHVSPSPSPRQVALSRDESPTAVIDMPNLTLTNGSNGTHSIHDRIDWWSDFKMLMVLAAPNSATFLVSFLINFSSVIFIGRLGPQYMGAAALANMLANLFGFSIGLGATSALDALCSQAYGAKSYQLVGRHTQRAMVVLTMLCFPVAIVWTYAATLLGWMGVDEEICKLAGHYVYILILGMWPNFMFECLRRYLQAQSILWPIVVSAISTAVVSIASNYLFIFVYDLGFSGPAIASALGNWVMFSTVCLCTWLRSWWRRRQRLYAPLGSTRVETMENGVFSSPSPVSQTPMSPMSPVVELTTLTHRGSGAHQFPSSSSSPTNGSANLDDSSANGHLPPSTEEALDLEDTWPSIFSTDIFCGWGEFLKLAVPGAASVFIEWGSYEVSASMAARLGATNLAVHSIYMQTAGLFYMVPLGVATAASICVGQFLGAGRADRAQEIANLALMLHAIYPILCGFLLMIVLKPYWGMMFTDDSGVLASCSYHLPIMALYLFFDHIKCICMAILRGCGRAPVTVWGNTLSCWMVGFPLAYLLVFHPYQFELFGLWTSMSMAWATASLVYYCVILRTDWVEEVASASRRTERSLSATKPTMTHATHPRQSPPPTSSSDSLDSPSQTSYTSSASPLEFDAHSSRTKVSVPTTIGASSLQPFDASEIELDLSE